ncbi:MULTISPECIES: class I SAM-dependent RNA methyltransferase [unclassified Oceanispirochaeta]|nr:MULTISPECIES: class I SAM-dependent RNA methyltransferase [unclassified Oceanispirochaeta]MBF9018656.1 class I SAM-dependent RNA methyltransferase [Oceanispirochaeta sp. M2]NPD75093.1 class I SAM-dependent RNA methyltransferase [Oceanispirochaeta sp. M1]RDG29050.1 class I SAM-dependent RNA methyltransferase [Oceanispirochaeta sp. M1]
MKKMKSKKSSISSTVNPQYNSVRAEKVVPGGDGLFRIEGKVVFVPAVLEGETADIELVQQGKKFSRGRVLQLHETSPYRVEPFCSYYGRCGGCNFQHISYEKQLELKTSFVREHFRKFSSLELAEDFYFAASEPRAYRNRVQFHKAADGCGFKKRGSDSVIKLKSCPVLAPGLDKFLSSSETIKKDREIFFGTDSEYWSGRERENISIELRGKNIQFRSDLFFQSNLSLLPEMLDYIVEFSDESKSDSNHAMDLYCGVGLFSVFLKETYNKITGIELNPETESYYVNNMKGSDFEFFGQSLEEWLTMHEGEKTDFIIVDPPRTGLSPEVRQFLIRMKVPGLVYVSCDPVTQARDTKELIEGGYEIESARGFDFYPQTHHMETVVRFRHK